MKTRYRPVIILLASLVLLPLPLVSQTVGVAAYQEGTDKSAPPEEFLIKLGSGCMDELFFSGLVATSEKPAVVTELEFREGRVLDLAQARDAFVTYEVMLLVSVSKSAFSKTLKIPRNAEYRIVEVSSGKILVQGALQGAEDGENPQKLIDEWCLQASKTIMPICLKTITERSGKVGS